MIKIAVSGTHSTGKTTVCKALYDLAISSGIDACRIPEAARIVFGERCGSQETLARDDRAEIQRKIFLTQLRLEDEAVSGGHDLVICDRTLMDIVVYARAYGVGGGMFKTFYRVAKHHLTTYDYIAVTKIDLAVAGGAESDGLRDADRHLWYAIEKGIHEEVSPNITIDGLRDVVRDLSLRTRGDE